MKITCISDTHGVRPILSGGDFLIYAGDDDILSMADLIGFAEWMEEQPYKYKVAVAGNHDFFISKYGYKRVFKIFADRDILYLENNGAEIGGLNVWGSPMSPLFGKWAFMDRQEELDKIWETIPENTDILITHTPPRDILDKTCEYFGNVNCGCFRLAKRVEDIKPKYHVFGHIHEGNGIFKKDGTTFINAAMVDEHYNPNINRIINIETED